MIKTKQFDMQTGFVKYAFLKNKILAKNAMLLDVVCYSENKRKLVYLLVYESKTIKE